MNYHHARFAQDRDILSARSAFIRAKKLSREYGIRLRKIAKQVGDLVAEFEHDFFGRTMTLQALLFRYADTITPWAEVTADRMIREVAQNDKQAWRRVSAEMGRQLHREIETAPTGIAMREAKARQVELIRSLPIEAAQRVHDLTTRGITEGRRASDIAAEIMRTGEVTKSRATLIARTETARTATELTKARAQHIGSTHFIWVTAGDGDVRPSHRALNGQAFRWDDPPECDPGHRALPGAIWNCRCIPRVIIPD